MAHQFVILLDFHCVGVGSSSLWQSVVVCGSFCIYKVIISIGLSAAGAKPSLESYESLEILRLFKFEDIITMVRRSVGCATPPSVMV